MYGTVTTINSVETSCSSIIKMEASARYRGLRSTRNDWSWGALIFDMDNDGLKDIFVANGIYKDLINQDYINFVADQNAVREILKSRNNGIKQLIDSIPSNRMPTTPFTNNGRSYVHQQGSRMGTWRRVTFKRIRLWRS
jgi:hypothetical protein